MSSNGTYQSNRELLADLKQDERNAKAGDEPTATKEHIAGPFQPGPARLRHADTSSQVHMAN